MGGIHYAQGIAFASCLFGIIICFGFSGGTMFEKDIKVVFVP